MRVRPPPFPLFRGRFMKKQEKKINELIHILDAIKKEFPEQIFVMETQNGTVTCKIKDALCYMGCDGSVVIDAE